jgi:hypothetical protein
MIRIGTAASLTIIASTLMIVLVLIVPWRQGALVRHEFRMTVHEMMGNVATGRGPL